MRKSKDPTERYSIIFLIVLYLISIILHIIPQVRPLIVKITELYMFLVTILIFAFGLLNNQRNLATYTFWCLFVFFCVYLIEVISINTGFILGSYSYGNALPTKIANVPLIVAFNWTVLILSCYGFFSKIIKNRFLRAVAGSVTIVVLDIFIEPVATHLDYWNWEFKTAPLQNYIAWFFISLIFSTFLAIFRIHARSAIFKIFLIMQFVFFILLNIFT